MKKMLSFAVVALSLAACTNETDVFTPDSQSITLKSVTQKQSRGAVAAGTLPEDTKIYLGAAQVIDGAGSASTYFQYLSNVEFTYNSTNSNWISSGCFYPATGNLHFLAYTCDYSDDYKKPDANWVLDPTNKKFDYLELKFAGATNPVKLNGQTDVMYSDVYHAERQADGKFTEPTLQFHHTMAWVVVKIQRKDKAAPTNSSIKIRNVKVADVQLNGDLKVTVGDYDTTTKTYAYTPAWTVSGAAADYYLPDFATANKKTDDNYLGDEIGNVEKYSTKGMLIPQTAEKTISFEYCTRNGADSYTEWVKYEAPLQSPALTWETNKKYIYTFSIQTNQITVKATVKDLDDPEEIDVTI